jgi:hypothetical protein
LSGSGAHPDPIEAPARDGDASRRNRAILVWITLACLVLAAAGYAFARWMMTQPPPPQ